MMNLEGFKMFAGALRARGFDEAKAQKYAALIGDTPETDAAGKWIVRDDSGIILDVIEPLLVEE